MGFLPEQEELSWFSSQQASDRCTATANNKNMKHHRPWSASSRCPIIRISFALMGFLYTILANVPVQTSAVETALTHTNGNNTNVRFEPDSLTGDDSRLRVGAVKEISLIVKVPSSEFQSDQSPDSFFARIKPHSISPNRELITLPGGQEYHLTAMNRSLSGNQLSDHAKIHEYQTKIPVKGLFLGHAKLQVDIFRKQEENPPFRTPRTSPDNSVTSTPLYRQSYAIDVIRDQDKFDVVFRVIIIGLVWINYINMGCSLDINVIKEVIRKPYGPIIGLVTQFTVMPLASYFIGSIFFAHQLSLRLGLFVLGCSPGGSQSNFWTLLFDGDVDLSITMTFISTVAALAFMPMWLFTLGGNLVEGGGKLVIPFRNLFFSLFTLSIPLAIGFFLAYKLPRASEISQRIIKPFTITVLLVIVLITSFMYNHIYLMFTWDIMSAASLLTICGYTFGAAIAWAARLPVKQIIAVSIETAFQNGGIAFVLLILSMRKPEADIAGVPCIAQVVVCSIPLFFIYLGLKLSQRYTREKVPVIPY